MTHAHQGRSSPVPLWTLVVIGIVALLVAGLVGALVAHAVETKSASSGSSGLVRGHAGDR